MRRSKRGIDVGRQAISAEEECNVAAWARFQRSSTGNPVEGVIASFRHSIIFLSEPLSIRRRRGRELLNILTAETTALVRLLLLIVYCSGCYDQRFTWENEQKPNRMTPRSKPDSEPPSELTVDTSEFLKRNSLGARTCIAPIWPTSSAADEISRCRIWCDW